jgi:hypothetical protein
MDRTACTEPQCLYKGVLYLYLTVELYLYSPYGPYGLYRASVPVQGRTLPLPYSIAIPLLSLCAVRPVQSLSACTRAHFTFTLLNVSQYIADTPFACRFFLQGCDPVSFGEYFPRYRKIVLISSSGGQASTRVTRRPIPECGNHQRERCENVKISRHLIAGACGRESNLCAR